MWIAIIEIIHEKTSLPILINYNIFKHISENKVCFIHLQTMLQRQQASTILSARCIKAVHHGGPKKLSTADRSGSA
jgi:hypothetical protein